MLDSQPWALEHPTVSQSVHRWAWRWSERLVTTICQAILGPSMSNLTSKLGSWTCSWHVSVWFLNRRYKSTHQCPYNVHHVCTYDFVCNPIMILRLSWVLLGLCTLRVQRRPTADFLRCLKPGGKVAIQAICVPDERYETYRHLEKGWSGQVVEISWRKLPRFRTKRGVRLQVTSFCLANLYPRLKVLGLGCLWGAMGPRNTGLPGRSKTACVLGMACRSAI